ncbi:MAG TPA: type VI secretion system ATPase TssH [Sandaracinaceae bacterium LLY-WYZ-13_1]|nr:type VI secretion system ATPase TssH [Sandaracinaceae bacterium LLY-WYZ-13_1]
MAVQPKSFVNRMTPTARRMLEAAVGRAASAEHGEVTVEHMLAQMVEPDDGDVAAIYQQLGMKRTPLQNRIEKLLQHMSSGHAGRPRFSGDLWKWIEDAWVFGSLVHGAQRIRTGHMFFKIVENPGLYIGEVLPELEDISLEQLEKELDEALSVTSEEHEAAPAPAEAGGGAPGVPTARKGEGALDRFCTNLTEEVRAGRSDPIFGRHREVRQCIDILSRRRKNNPIIVGEPGVGKTALVEGLAHAIVAGDVPKHIAKCDIMALDLGALQAGASVKGEFENRLKAVISEVKSSDKPIILFIDEAHTLIGAGNQKGGGDAANLLKPALARGELRTIAATTWAEYKKYFEKDAALERRFQPVKVDEPDEENAIVMLRGLRQLYEDAHGIRIKDEAIVAAVELSSRYIAGRLLPDKAVDLLDTTAARVRVERQTKPEELVELEAQIAALERAVKAIDRDVQAGDEHRREELEEKHAELERVKGEREALHARWQAELEQLQALLKERGELEEEEAGEDAEGDTEAGAEAGANDGEKVSESAAPEPARVDDAEAGAEAEASGSNGASSEAEASGSDGAGAATDEGGEPLIHIDVDSDAVARTVSVWTGIPLGKMQRDTIGTVMQLEDRLRDRVKGQEPAVEAVAEACRMAYAGVRNPDAPVGVFLFVGPSGVGKTETALALAEELYGGERFITQINMSEYQEKHTVSRLIGSPPGYVGYGEGGILTEAVRQRPYSVVLLDECEKADPDVLNLFYQVFDKGVMNDGEGRLINFKNTICILTSNLATDEIMKAYEGETVPPVDEVVGEIRPILSKWFKPALLARMTVVPYRPIDPETMKLIAGLKLNRLARRIRESHGIETVFEEDLIEDLAKRCTESETGARNVDHILRSTLTPMIARGLLEHMAEGQEPAGIDVSIAPSGEWRVDIDVA